MTGTEQLKETVLPVLREGDVHSSFPPLLHSRNFADFTREAGYYIHLFQLVLTLYHIEFDNPVVLDQLEKLQEDASMLDSQVVSFPSIRTEIFISYSHQDKKWLDKLLTMLKPLERQELIKTWSDTLIEPGTKWKEEINRALASAKVAILLVSPDFLASDFIAKNELPPLLEAAEKKGLTILWIAISSSMYKATEIGVYQAVNKPEEPLDSLTRSKVNRELVLIAEKIKGVVAES